MHKWGDLNVDWDGICDSAEFIGKNLKRFGRVDVSQYKEKFGTVRVYMNGFGIFTLHDITHPGYVYYQYKYANIEVIPNWLNKLVIIPYQKFLYRFLYKKMVRKFSHLREEILCCADYPELLNGL